MPLKTQPVYDLVREVLATLPEPYSEDITEDVCIVIEHRPDWASRYYELVEELGRDVVNNWIGRYTKEITGRRTGRQVSAKRTKLISSYAKMLP